MFTGLIEAMGTVVEWRGAQLVLRCPFAAQLAPGESVAVSGVCLTVEQAVAEGFRATVIPATRRRTTLGRLGPGDAVNLERAVPAAGRLGGHVVQGHVDGVGTLTARRPDEDWDVLEFEAPAEVLRYVWGRGSVAVDGVSLTVAERTRDGGAFRVGIIPHTAARTTLGALREGASVNLEADVLAKYVEGAVASLGPAWARGRSAGP